MTRRRFFVSAAIALVPGAGLAQEAATLPMVPVTASPVQTGQAGSFVPLTTLDQPAIAEVGARSLAELLAQEPGIAATSFAPGASRPVIRGLDNFRVRLQENGFSAGDVSSYGEDHAPPLDPWAAERVEVIRGPASLRWGSQAIGGVVNVINNRIPTALPDRAVQGRAGGGWSSGSRGWDGGASADVRAGNWVLHGDVFGRKDQDYRLPGGGSQANSFVRSDGQAMGLSYIGEQGFIGTSISRFRSLYGIPGGEEAKLGIAIDMEQTRWASRGEYRPASGPIRSIAYWLGFSRYRHEEIGLEHEDHEEGEAHDHAEAGGPVVHGGFRNLTWDGRLELQHQPIVTGLGPLDGTLGLSVERERLRTTGEFLEFLPPARTDRYAAYLFEEMRLTPTLRLQAAARIEAVRITGETADFSGGLLPADAEQALENAGRRRNFAPMSASLGLLQDLPWAMQARLTGAYAERAPSAAELLSRGAHDASGTFDIGDPGLRKERAVSAELGLARQTGSFRFDTSAFLSHFDGFIYHALTGNSCGEDFASCSAGNEGEFLQSAYGQRDARFYGVEAKAEQDLFRVGPGQFGVSARYDFVRAEFTDGSKQGGGGNLPRIPPHRLGGGVFWRGGGWNTGLDYLHAFDQDRVAAAETSTKGYELLNARIAYTAALDADRALTLAVVGSNLLDRDMRNSASFKKDEVLLPGRAIRFMASLAF